MRHYLPVLAFCLVVAGSLEIATAAPRSEADPPPSQSHGAVTKEAMALDEETAAMRKLIERALTDPEVRGSLTLLTECRNETGMRTMRIWSDGLGTWQRKKQIQLPVLKSNLKQPFRRKKLYRENW